MLTKPFAERFAEQWIHWKKALALAPTFRFELVNTLLGVDSITLYKSIRGMAAEN